jgi:hypothetical protein
MAVKNVAIDFEFLNYISAPPAKTEDLYASACSSDKVTIKSWKDTWLGNMKANKEKYGSFADQSAGEVWGKFAKKPMIVMGSGPSLANALPALKDNSKAFERIGVISCLHNYHYCIDNEIHVDYFVSLDAGKVTIEEISEGGKLSHEEYIESTKDKTLLAYVGSPPELLAQWKGKILFFTCPLPDQSVVDEMKKIEDFNILVSTGGNVLGACSYFAKAIMGANPICWVGADFSFSYDKRFHPWNSKYDGKLGQAMRAVDVFGNKVLTWRSYFNFKNFFDWLALTIPGIYYNASEGGTLGAYPEGNIDCIRQTTLDYFVRMYNLHYELKAMCDDPKVDQRKILY